MGFFNQEAKAPKVPKVPLTPEEQALQDKKNAKLNAGLGAGLGAASTVLGTLDTDPEIGAMDYAKNATSMAATGATVGGPVGAGVGAVVGLGMTYFQQQQQKEAQKAKEQAESLNIGIQRQQFQAVAEGGLIGHVQKLVDGNEVQSPVIPQVQQASYINEDPYNVASFTKKMNEAKQQMFDSRITPRDASVSIPSSLSPQAQQSIINSNIEKAQSNLVATSFKTKEQIAKEANYTKAAEDRDKRLQTEGKALKLVGKGVGALMGFNPEHPVESIPETLATGLVLGGIGHHAVQKLAAKEAASVATSGAAKAGMERLGINAIKAAESTHKAVHVDHAITEAFPEEEVSTLTVAPVVAPVSVSPTTNVPAPKKILTERASGGAIPDNTTYGKQAVNKGMKKGGPVIGPGTGTSDSVRTSLQPGDFVVPAMNASLAIQLRQMYLGGSVDAIKPGEKNGSAPVALSNGEHVFTKDERMMLEKQGVNLDRLAPNAEKTGYGMVKGGVVGNRNIKTKVTSEVQSADGNQKLETAEKAAVTRKKFDQKFKELYKNPNVRAYLNGIMHGEALPQNPSTGKNPDSSATGYFQFLEGTNKDILERYGFTGQSKDIEESAKAAIALMNDKDAIKDIVAGNFDEADKKLNKIWTSLPGGNESNVKTDSIPTLRKEYIENKGQIKSVQGAKSYIPYEDPTNTKSTKNPDGKTGVVVSAQSYSKNPMNRNRFIETSDEELPVAGVAATAAKKDSNIVKGDDPELTRKYGKVEDFSLDVFAKKVLEKIGAPTTEKNIQSLKEWAKQEGNVDGKRARYNPFNTSLKTSTAVGNFNSHNVKHYQNFDAGVQATADTLLDKKGRYKDIVEKLKNESDVSEVKDAIERSPWGTDFGNRSKYYDEKGNPKEGAIVPSPTSGSSVTPKTTTANARPSGLKLTNKEVEDRAWDEVFNGKPNWELGDLSQEDEDRVRSYSERTIEQSGKNVELYEKKKKEYIAKKQSTATPKATATPVAKAEQPKYKAGDLYASKKRIDELEKKLADKNVKPNIDWKNYTIPDEIDPLGLTTKETKADREELRKELAKFKELESKSNYSGASKEKKSKDNIDNEGLKKDMELQKEVERKKLVAIQLKIADEEKNGGNSGEHVERARRLKERFDAQMKQYQKASNPANYKKAEFGDGKEFEGEASLRSEQYVYSEDLAVQNEEEEKKQAEVNKPTTRQEVYMPKEKPVPYTGQDGANDLANSIKFDPKKIVPDNSEYPKEEGGILASLPNSIKDENNPDYNTQRKGANFLSNAPKSLKDEDAELNIFNKLGGIGGLAALGQTAFGLAGLVSNQKNDPGPYKGDPYLTVLRNQASLDATRLDPAIKAEGERQIELTRRTRNAEIQRMSAGDTGLAMGAMRESAIDKSRGIMGLAALQEQTMDSRKQYLGQRADAVTNDNMRVYDSKNNRFMMNQQAAAGLLNTGITNFIGATNYSQYMNQLASAEGDPAAMQIKMGQQIANTPVLPPPTVTPPIDPIK